MQSRGGGLSFLHKNRASSEDKISDENSASVLLAYLNGDREYVVFNPYGEQEGGVAHRRSIVGLEETGTFFIVPKFMHRKPGKSDSV